MVKVSVVMPNYNGEKYIGEAIKSVLNQSFNDLELIIVDDASTDNSRKIIDSFEDERIIKLYQHKNRHVAYTTNVGFSRARSQYIARIDSDDIWAKDKLEKQVKFMDENPKYGACFSRVEIINESGDISNSNIDLLNHFNYAPNRSQKEWLNYFFDEGNCLCNPSALIRKQTLDQIGNGYNIAYVPAQDLELWCRLLIKAPIYIIEEKLTYYRWENSDTKISGNDTKSEIAFYNVHTLIRKHFFDIMNNQEFIDFFQERFKNKKSKTDFELDFEKAFLLLGSDKRSNIKWLGIEKFEELFKNINNVEILEDIYGFELKEYYKLYRESNFFDHSLRRQIFENETKIHNLSIEKEKLISENTELRNNLNNYHNELTNMLNSISWKITYPLRKISRFKKGK